MATSKKAPPAKKKIKQEYIYAVGRRKNASARVRLYLKKGKMIVNGLPIAKYFPGPVAEIAYNRPFKVCDCLGKFYATVKVVGSGKESQLLAIIHGLARTLDKADREKYHPVLKKNGLLTRDSRQRERRKAGQAGRARHKKQSPKR
ncbi:30S ribosomal protein S9 [Patescibacteria group bacterium]